MNDDGRNDLEAASAPPTVPEKDWSKSLFYSHTLRSCNFDYPPDQLGLYLFTLTATGMVSKAFWKSWNIEKAADLLKNGVVESEMLSFHRHFSGLTNERLLNEARMMRNIVRFKSVASAGLLVSGFCLFVQFKNINRFDE